MALPAPLDSLAGSLSPKDLKLNVYLMRGFRVVEALGRNSYVARSHGEHS